jgi:UDP-N-acetylmuramoyl-tripeptide--D-alanyl-D-alanine ligase
MILMIMTGFILAAAISVQLMSKRTKDSLHMVQLEGYLADHYLKWLSTNKKKAYSLSGNEAPIKKPLVMTPRATRLYRANFLISATLVALPAILVNSISSNLVAGLVVLLASMAAVYYYQPIVMALSTMAMKPVEDNINMGYYRAAQSKVKSRDNLEVVGITGSFGKTSTKFIVGTILSQKFNVLNTPESYNTPMGLSKVINNDLSDEHEVFVAEMGAKTIGEIREVAQLAQPRIGILTSIGPVHMDTYKNIDNIMKTKYELIEELPTDGVAVFNYDNEYIRKLADKTFKEKMLYGFENVEELDMYAEDIVVNEKGSEFTLRDREGNSVRCRTKLLGRHNIYNLLAGACVSKILGLSFEEISMGIEKVEPVEHRLNLIESTSGIIVIDDAFNSNPVGTRAALDVLSQFKEGRKIIVTPGMIELGEMEESANHEFGVNIGKVCDYVILVGEQRTKPIYEGLMDTSFNPSNIIVVNNLQEATEEIGKITKPKDVVLFENDLPDNYSE